MGGLVSPPAYNNLGVELKQILIQHLSIDSVLAITVDYQYLKGLSASTSPPKALIAILQCGQVRPSHSNR